MKKLNVYATAVNINGKKSNGVEDYEGYQHFKLADWHMGLDYYHPID